MKTKFETLIPDSRLRLERRPPWLNRPLGKNDVDAVRLSRIPSNGQEFLTLVSDLINRVETLTVNDDHPIDPSFHGRRCRVCQCTEHDCEGCVELIGKPCEWHPLDPTVCTACVKPETKGRAR